jgi:hypothetical protein
VKWIQEEKSRARYDLKEKIRCREALSVKSFATRLRKQGENKNRFPDSAPFFREHVELATGGIYIFFDTTTAMYMFRTFYWSIFQSKWSILLKIYMDSSTATTSSYNHSSTLLISC